MVFRMSETETETTRAAEVSFKSVSRILDADDPSPEERRDLTDRSEERIFHAVLDTYRGMRAKIANQLVIRVPAEELSEERKAAIVSAIRCHFRSRADEVGRGTRLTVRVGLREVRLTVAVCLPSFIAIALIVKFMNHDPLGTVLENILVIFCWVTIWQPFQSLVFDRWTLKETASVYQKISAMDIRVIPE